MTSRAAGTTNDIALLLIIRFPYILIQFPLSQGAFNTTAAPLTLVPTWAIRIAMTGPTGLAPAIRYVCVGLRVYEERNGWKDLPL